MHNIPASVGPVFHSFSDSFAHQLDIYNNSTSTELLTQVTTMLNDSLCELGKSYKCFEKCQLIQAGSVAEKTKVEALDEFDFLVVMEYFADKEYFEIVLRQGLIRIYVKDISVIEFLPIECQNHSGSIEFLDVTLRSKFMELFIEIFDESLPSGWCGWRQPKQNKQTRNETLRGVSQQVRLGTILRVGKTRKPRKTKGDG